MAAQKFHVLFCQRFDCPPSKYEARALSKLLYSHARFVVPMIRKLSPDFSAEDLKFIRSLGEAEDFGEAEASVSEFRVANLWTRSFWRSRCRLRGSGAKAGKLVRQLFPAKPPATEPARETQVTRGSHQ